jgi:type II secretory pathway component PulK
MMKNRQGILEETKGMALITTLLFLAVMGILATGLIFTVQNEMKTSANYKYSQQAFHIANAGVQRALDWFVTNYNPHLPAGDYNATTMPVTLAAGGNVRLGASAAFPDGSVASAYTGK